MLKQENRPCQVQGFEGEFVFRCYAQDYEEFQNGAAPVPVAIVENVQTGQVQSVYVGKVMFTTTLTEQLAQLKEDIHSTHQLFLKSIGGQT